MINALRRIGGGRRNLRKKRTAAARREDCGLHRDEKNSKVIQSQRGGRGGLEMHDRVGREMTRPGTER